MNEKLRSWLWDRLILIVLLAFVLSYDWPCLNSLYLTSDTLLSFEQFYSFYNEFFFHGVLPQWLPNQASFGLPSNLPYMEFMSVGCNVSFILGKLFSVRGTLLLFKLAVVIDQFILVMGMFLLTRLLFKRRITVFIVCLSVLASICWGGFIEFQLYLFYLIPLILYFFIRSFEIKDIRFFWMGVLALICSISGTTPYFFAIKFFVVSLVVIQLFLKYRPGWDFFKFDKINLILIGIITLLLFSFYYQLSELRSFIDLTKREALGGQNSLGVFLTYGAEWGHWQDFINILVSGCSVWLYLGILPFFFLIYSFFSVRSKEYFIFFVVGAAMFWVVCGGLFAALCYYYPLMSYFRHLGYSWGSYKIFFAICAGYGLEKFFDSSSKERFKLVCISFLFLVFLCDSAGITQNWLIPLIVNHVFWQQWMGDFQYKSTFFRVGTQVIGLGVLLAVLSTQIFLEKSQGTKKFILMALEKLIYVIFIVCVLLDIHSYHQVMLCVPPAPEKNFETVLNLYPIVNTLKPVEFKSSRFNNPGTKFEKMGLVLDGGGGGNDEEYSIAQFSTCQKGSSRIFPKEVNDLWALQDSIPPNDFNLIIGCGYPKLRLLQGVKFAKNALEAESILKNNFDASNYVVIEDKTARSPKTLEAPLPSSELGVINVSGFNSNSLSLDVDVTAPGGTWLVYSDAFHKNWRAKVDGKSTRIEKANIAFKGIFLEHGKHHVDWHYGGSLNTVTFYFMALTELCFSLYLVYISFLGLMGFKSFHMKSEEI